MSVKHFSYKWILIIILFYNKKRHAPNVYAFLYFNREPSKRKKRKVKRGPNDNFLLDFKELTKFDESNIKAYEQSKGDKIRNQNELLAGQQDERQGIMEGNKRPRDTYYEELWASKDPGTKMPKEGRGKYS